MTLFWMHLRKDIKKMTKIIFATGNAGKMREIRDIMADLDVELLSMKEAGIKLDIVEDGKTFEENALIKARAVSKEALCGAEVLSGMARGIDAYGHIGALKAGGNTYAVLGCGVNICYPRTNQKLYEDILSHGGIISEYPPETEPIAQLFPARNRIISALSDVVVIVEAKERSGSLITADFALEQGKDIYAVPGRVTDSLSMGCNNLIRQGAGIINSVEDFVKDLELYACNDTTQENFNKLLLEKDESLVYACLSLRPKSMEELLKKTGFARPQIADILQRLIQKDFITESFKNYYIRKI